MFNVVLDLDPAWYEEQRRLALLARPAGGRKSRKLKERLLIGYVDGVLILAFPRFEVSTTAPGSGAGWFSLNPEALSDLLKTFTGRVHFSIGPESFSMNKYRSPHSGLGLRLGADDPELPLLAARIEELAAEQCYRQLLQADAAQRRIAEVLEWHRADHAVNTAPLMEHIRDHSLIVFRLPEAAADSLSRRAIVDSKQIQAKKVFLQCHDFSGAKITVDPRWVTHVGC